VFTLITGQKSGVLAVKRGLFTHKFTVKPPFIAWCDRYFLPVGVNIKEYSFLFSKIYSVSAGSGTLPLIYLRI
jgi:hypothetical protein